LPKLYIIAGCNGAGKTTASYTILPEILDCKEFVNADEIARGISPFQPEKVAFELGRIMLNRIKSLLDQQVNFAFETTLSTRSFLHYIKFAKSVGYETTLLFFWLNSMELAVNRVKIRVKEGGHDIPTEVIKRRYIRGILNFLELYKAEVDNWIVVNNSGKNYGIIAESNKSKEDIYNVKIWNIIKTYSNG